MFFIGKNANYTTDENYCNFGTLIKSTYQTFQHKIVDFFSLIYVCSTHFKFWTILEQEVTPLIIAITFVYVDLCNTENGQHAHNPEALITD